VEFLDGVLGERGHKLDRILHLVVDVEKLIARLLLRAHIEGRPDDTEAVIRRRQEIYAHETAPLLAVYEDHGILAAIDGNGRVEDVAKRILAVLEM
jgi:adenylate kinase